MYNTSVCISKLSLDPKFQKMAGSRLAPGRPLCTAIGETTFDVAKLYFLGKFTSKLKGNSKKWLKDKNEKGMDALNPKNPKYIQNMERLQGTSDGIDKFFKVFDFGGKVVTFNAVLGLMNKIPECGVKQSNVDQPQSAAAQTLRQVCLKTANGKHFVVAENDKKTVNADRTACGAWETFSIGDLNGGALENGDKVTLKAHHQRYLSAQPNGHLEANRTKAEAWEAFTIIRAEGSGQIKSFDRVGLQGAHGKWLVAEGAGGKNVKVDRKAMGAWETFIITAK
jgi:hypothetical protein